MDLYDHLECLGMLYRVSKYSLLYRVPRYSNQNYYFITLIEINTKIMAAIVYNINI